MLVGERARRTVHEVAVSELLVEVLGIDRLVEAGAIAAIALGELRHVLSEVAAAGEHAAVGAGDAGIAGEGPGPISVQAGDRAVGEEYSVSGGAGKALRGS